MARAQKKSVYDESSIEILEGLEGVRRKPGMYLGEEGPARVFRMAKELIDNALDEAQAGRNTEITFYANVAKHEYIVADKGEGIPVGINTKHKQSTLTLIFTKLHAGGKFNDKAYSQAAGTHGVGASATNALSLTFEVWTRRDGKWHYQSFAKGKPTIALPKTVPAPPADVLKALGHKPVRGTVIRFVPEQPLVVDEDGNCKLDLKLAYEWLKGVADLNTGLKIVLRTPKIERVMLNKKGPSELLAKRVEALKAEVIGKPILYEDTQMTLALRWTTYPKDDGLLSYVSCSPTKEHGTHYVGLTRALYKAIGEHATEKQKYQSQDVLYGLVGAFNWRMSEPAFSSQIKDKLTSNVSKAVYDKVYPILHEFFKANSALARRIIKRAIDIKKIQDQQAKLLEGVAKAAAKTKGVLLPNVLAQADCKPDQRELYIVEGDSAAGTAKLARNEKFQEVMRAKGKPLNCMDKKSTLAKCLANVEVQNLLIALGVNPKGFKAGAGVDVSTLRVQHLYFLADADVDGKHIEILLLGFLYRFMPELVDAGRVHVIDSPLFNCVYKGKRYYGKTSKDVVAQLPKGASAQIMRSKGWGEVSVEALRDLAFDVDTRRVITIDQVSKKDRAELEDLLGRDPEKRKILLGLA